MPQRWRNFVLKSAKKPAICGSSQHFPPFLLSPPCLQPVKPPQTPFSSTNRRRRSLHTNPNPYQWQNSHHDRRASLLWNYNSRSLFMQWTLGRAVSGPTQISRSGPPGPNFLKKKFIKKIPKNLSKNVCDFLVYFSIYFV
jgi:hypothetical protein